MKPGPDADRVLLAHVGDCLSRILEYTNSERSRFDTSRLVQDAVIRNLQTLAESSQRLSSEIKATEPSTAWPRASVPTNDSNGNPAGEPPVVSGPDRISPETVAN